MKFQKRDLLFCSIGVLLALVFSPFFKSLVSAEQSGTTPNSGATSYIKQLYDSLVSLGNGSDSSGSWGDWGGVWNRIRSSSEWVPSGDAISENVLAGKTFYGSDRTEQTGTLVLTGDATVDDVVLGKTFYSDSLTQITGTGPEPIDFSLQQFVDRDDYAGIYFWGNGPEDYQGEEAAWTDHTVGEDVVWKDERAGVYWTSDRVFATNDFNIDLCDFFSTNNRRDYDGSDTDCDEAINYCSLLTYGGRSDWYLPSQKELMQAYIDGIYNQAGDTQEEAASFVWGNPADTGGWEYWSSTETSDDSAYAWKVYLYSGDTGSYPKGAGFRVRCVARD